MLSVIIPAYNEELSVETAYFTVYSLMKKENIDCEIIFVDDGSTDSTYSKIIKLAENGTNLCGLHFSRNFGKEAAISAGLAAATGSCAVVVDCDLQYPTEKIIEMYRLWEQGYEIVEGVKASRGQESKFHCIAAKAFYSVISSAIGIDMSNASDFKLLDRKVIDVVNKIPERKGFFRAISYWVGYKKTTVEFEVNERMKGCSKWSTKSLIKYALSNISAYSSAPMQIVTVLGMIMLAIMVIFGALVLAGIVTGKISELLTTAIFIIIFTGSILMISLGVIGYYISRIYEEIKGRPKYIISESCRSEK